MHTLGDVELELTLPLSYWLTPEYMYLIRLNDVRDSC